MVGRLKPYLPLVLCFALCGIVFATLDDYGITWDEPEDSLTAEKHVSWFSKPTWSRIDPCWRTDEGHPPLGTLAGGIIQKFLSHRLGIMQPYKAFRLQALLYGFALNFVLFTWVTKYWGWATGLVAVLAFFFLPRAFFHAHLGVLDFPITAMWVVTAYAFWRGLENSRWILVASAFVGLSLLTKVNGMLLWAFLLAWFVVWFRSDLWRLLRRRFRGRLKERPHAVRDLVFLLVIPPVVFVAGWPWLWPHPAGRTWDYFVWVLTHHQIPVYYLGKTWLRAPWHYAFVLTAVTVPLIVLFPFFVGLLRLHRSTHRAAAVFLLSNALVPILVVAFVSAWAYDGVRLFLPAFPFLCAVAALGVRELYLTAARIKWGTAFICLYGILFALSVYCSIVRYHPYESSYFNELVGGVNGAAARGFETEYWGSPFQAILPWLNSHPNNALWVPIQKHTLPEYQSIGRLAPTIRFVDRSQGDYLVLLIRQGELGRYPHCWEFYTQRKPVFSIKVFDTLLVGIYDWKTAREPTP